MNIFTSFFITVLIALGSTSAIAQGTWFTSLNEGLASAKKEGKLAVVEVGILRNTNSTFIGNETWNDSLVENQLINYIPITVELDRNDPFFQQHAISVTPTILIMDADKEVHFEVEGMLDAKEIAEILEFMYYDATRIVKLNSAYSDGVSLVGKMQMAEEFVYLAYKAPINMKRYFFNKSLVKIAGLEQQFKKEGNTAFATRSRIIFLGQEIQAGDYESAMNKLAALNQGELSVKNELLASFYLSIAYYLADKKADVITCRKKINSLIPDEMLARRYSEKLDLLLGPIEE